MNKKILAVLMALMMVLTSVAAFAEGNTEAQPFSKVYTAEGNTAVAPGATFEFEVTDGAVVEGSTSVEDVEAPNPSVIKVEPVVFDTTDTKEIKVTIDAADFPEVGIYTYKLKEKNTQLAGINYDSTEMTLYVFRTGDGQVAWSLKEGENGAKSESGQDMTIDNVYQAGSLTVTKKVEGAYADPNMDFEITVTLKAADDQDYSKAAVKANGPGYENVAVTVGTPITFEIHNGETITLSNIPHDVTYTVTEADYTSLGYTSTITGGDSIITSTEQDDVVVTNTKDGGDIDTGVFTDNMPYFMLLAFVMILAAAVVLKKRTVNE